MVDTEVHNSPDPPPTHPRTATAQLGEATPHTNAVPDTLTIAVPAQLQPEIPPTVAATSLETALTDRALSIHTVAQKGQEGHIPNYADDRVSIDTHSRTASLGGTATHPRGEFTTMMAEAAEADTQHSEQDYPTVTQRNSTIQCGRCNGNHLTRNCPDSEPCA